MYSEDFGANFVNLWEATDSKIVLLYNLMTLLIDVVDYTNVYSNNDILCVKSSIP